MTLKSLTPLQLVKLILLGTLLIDVSWLLDFLPFRWPKSHTGFWVSLWTMRPAILIVGVFILGAFVLWQSYRRLSKELGLDTWTEEQLDLARKWSNSPALSWYTWLVLLTSMTILVLGHILHFRWNVLVLIYATYPLNWMKAKLRKTPPPREMEDWRQRPGFFSSHWGEPPADRSGSV